MPTGELPSAASHPRRSSLALLHIGTSEDHALPADVQTLQLDQPVHRPLLREVDEGESARASIGLSDDVDALDLSEGRQRHLDHLVGERIVEPSDEEPELRSGLCGLRAGSGSGAVGSAGRARRVGETLVDVHAAAEELDARLLQRVLEALRSEAAQKPTTRE